MGLITVRSFSAVGLFLGFLVRDTLTKLWKLVDLQDKMILNKCIDQCLYSHKFHNIAALFKLIKPFESYLLCECLRQNKEKNGNVLYFQNVMGKICF